MRLELSSDDTKLVQFTIGNLSKKKTHENMQEKLFRICSDGFSERTMNEYLTAINCLHNKIILIIYFKFY